MALGGVPTVDERDLRVRLGYWLQGQRACQEPGWLEAIQNVPRQRLVPAGWCDRFDGSRYSSEDVSPEEWLDTLNHDITIITREDELGHPTSSSTMPSVVTKMLDFLHVKDGNQIMEIGTGTGYSTALLCHRLGAARVVSIDNQADLVELARERLRQVGFDPHLVAVHGAEGYPGRAPYDRVIGTCFTWPVPSAWIEQARPSGRIVAVVPTGVVGLDVREDGSASGHYHEDVFGFMFMRGHMPNPLSVDETNALMSGPSTSGRWRYSPAILAAGGWYESSFALLAHTLVVPLEYVRWNGHALLPPTSVTLIDISDRSWAHVEAASQEVTQGGPRRLWDEVEALYEEWCRVGAPNRRRFGLTVQPDGTHTLWLDDSESECRWTVIRPGS